MRVRLTAKHDGIVICEGGVLVTDSENPSENGAYDGWVAMRVRNGEWEPNPFGFDDTPSGALADLEAQL